MTAARLARPRKRPAEATRAEGRRRRQTAERQRRYRQRQRGSEIVLMVSLSPEEVAKLVALHALDAHQVEDREAIGQALHALLGSINLEK
jgi:hypothetical protein